MTNLTAQIMRQALQQLDALIVAEKISQDVSLIVGGGGAMILAHGFPLATTDIDAIPRGMSVSEMDPLVKKVAHELKIAPDWLNPYFSTFAHTLPQGYGDRLIEVFKGKKLRALALGKEEMLIMKCFAHRQKDVGHAKALINKGANVSFVEDHIESLKKKNIPGSDQALDFLDDIVE
ncbi:MAG: DUF6036 family nucleotidyltransferase [Bdellovibrionota bacterium]